VNCAIEAGVHIASQLTKYPSSLLVTSITNATQVSRSTKRSAEAATHQIPLRPGQKLRNQLCRNIITPVAPTLAPTKYQRYTMID
jgi:hypothetical protein